MIFPVIMAGGTGTRFWPKSRSKKPKQFLSFKGDESLLQATVRRVNMLVPYENIYIVTNTKYMKDVMRQVHDIPKRNIIVEPMRRDTAACIGLAAIQLSKIEPEGVMVILPSDHHVEQDENFVKTLQDAVDIAKAEDCLVTLGLKPNSPKTGYGYIKRGREVYRGKNGHPVFTVERFTEKPDLQTAIRFLESGSYFWNSGMFICRVSSILRAIARYMPALAVVLEKIKFAGGTENEEELINREYRNIQKVSIDYGIMERADNVLVIPASFIWDDVGSWGVLESMISSDYSDNTIRGIHVGMDTSGCIIDSENKLVATIGVRDLIIVNTQDVVLICHKSRDQDVKELVKLLKNEGLRRFW
jgi:mannose-1-phosphate guanylyltransferase